MRWSVLFLVVCLLSGCLGTQEEASADSGPSEEIVQTQEPWDGATHLPVAQRIVEDGSEQELDALCTFGGTDYYELPRLGKVHSGTERLVFTVESGATATGVQAGYSRDGGDITWLPSVTADQRVFELPIEAAEVEDNGTRWAFHYQINLPEPATQECYTGAGAGGYSIFVEATRS